MSYRIEGDFRECGHTSRAAAIIRLVSSLENSALYIWPPWYFTSAPPLAISISGCNASIKDNAFCSPLEVDIPINIPFSRHLCNASNVACEMVLQYRGKGCARMLFEEFRKFACRSGVCRIELKVISENADALRLYQKLEFVETKKYMCLVL